MSVSHQNKIQKEVQVEFPNTCTNVYIHVLHINNCVTQWGLGAYLAIPLAQPQRPHLTQAPATQNTSVEK